MEFDGALRIAVRESGLTLDRIRHRLAGRGVTVSLATLSYWQGGRSRPRSRGAVTVLEDVLGLAPGALTVLLDASGPGADGPWADPALHSRLLGELDASGEYRLERVTVHDVLTVGPDRAPALLAVREVVRAVGADVDRVVCVHPLQVGTRLGALRFCRPGRVRRVAAPGGGLLGFELVLDRVLAVGDTAVVEYEVLAPDGPGPVSGYQRAFPRPVRDYAAVVQFDPATLPARCYEFGADTESGPRRRTGELWIGVSGGVHLACSDVRPGVRGLEWEWI